MANKNILVINGHPDGESFNAALTDAYVRGAKNTDAVVSVLHLRDLNFNPILRFGYRKRTPLEPDLEMALKKIKEADHIVWVFPMWWYGLPALLKGFIDRTFLPGITFAYLPGKALPKKLLTGKTSRLVVTADTPRWYDWLVMGQPAVRQFKKGTLQFCGIDPVKVTYIAPVKGSASDFREKWLKKVHALGLHQE